MKNLLTNQKGSVILLGILFLMVASVLFVYTIDLTRALLGRAKLYVTADMAALAGATEYDVNKFKNEGILELKEPDACNKVSYYVSLNGFDKGCQGILGLNTEGIVFKPASDCDVDNGDPGSQYAAITVTTHYKVKPLLFKGIFEEIPIQASSKSVLYVSH